jgi:hypothetical protein
MGISLEKVKNLLLAEKEELGATGLEKVRMNNSWSEYWKVPRGENFPR